MAKDLDGNGFVDEQDLAIMTAQWIKQVSPSADIAPLPNSDGIVNFLDFALLAQYWLEGIE